MTSQNENLVMVPIESIEVEGTRTRAMLRPTAIEDYTQALKAGEELDPCVVFRDGETTWLAAGHHRRRAHKRLDRTELPCVVKTGSKWDAIEYGIKDNLQHRGERISREDKRHNVLLVLRENSGLADIHIAELCGVSDKTVAKYRRESELSSEIPKTTTRTCRDGRRRDTSNIGPKPQEDRTPGAIRDANGGKADGGESEEPRQQPGGDTDRRDTRAGLIRSLEECYRKLGKMNDSLCDLFDATKTSSPDRAATCSVLHKFCRGQLAAVSTTLESWREQVGIDDRELKCSTAKSRR